MGLDASVYRSADHLPFDFTAPGVTIAPVTGLVDFDGPKLHRLYREQVVALHHRLQNVTHIAELRQQMAAIANSPVPFVNARILYSETHGGGYLEISPLDARERALEILSAGMKPGLRWVPTFIRQFRELIAVARQAGNLIYFGYNDVISSCDALSSPEARSTTHLFHLWASNNVRVLSIVIKVVSHRSAMTRKAVPGDCPFPLNLV